MALFELFHLSHAAGAVGLILFCNFTADFFNLQLDLRFYLPLFLAERIVKAELVAFPNRNVLVTKDFLQDTDFLLFSVHV